MRTAIAAVIAIFLAFSLHLDRPYWSGMTVVIVSNLYIGSIVDKALMRIIGTIIGVIVGLILASFVANSLFLYLVTNFLLISFAVYYYNFSAYAYAWLLGALGAFLVIAQLAIQPEDSFYVAIWRPIEIGLGVLVSSAAAFCIFPERLTHNLKKELNASIVLLDSLLDKIKQSILNTKDSWEEVTANNLEYKRQLKKSIEMLGFLRHELSMKKEKIDQFRVFFDLLYDLGRDVSYLIYIYPKELKFDHDVSQSIEAMFRAMQQDLRLLKKALLTEKAIKGSLQTAACFRALSVLLKEALPSKDLSYVYIVSFFNQVNELFTQLETVLIRHQKLKPPPHTWVSKRQQLSNDLDVIQHSIKAGLSAVLALVFWIISDWPGGLNGIISSVIISVRKDLFEMKHFSLHRLLGCLSGGVIALFPLAFFSLNLYSLLWLLFFPIWFFSYCSFKFPYYNYIGLQANIALILCLAQAGGPPSDLSPPLERLGGIIIGIVASFLVANVLWRAHPLALFEKNIKKMSNYLLFNMQSLFENKPHLYDLTHLFWLMRGLMESLDNHRLNVSKRSSFTLAKKKYTQLTVIQATLSHIQRSMNRAEVHHLAKKLDLDESLENVERDLLALYKENKRLRKDMGKERIKQHLEELDKAFIPRLSSSDRLNCLDYLKTLKQLIVLS